MPPAGGKVRPKRGQQQTTIHQGWVQGSFVEAEAEVKAEAESSRPRRDRLNSRQGRGEAE